MTDWTPLCMSPDELASWQAANRQTGSSNRAERPCADCTLAFAERMRAEYRCNGEPGDRGVVAESEARP